MQWFLCFLCIPLGLLRQHKFRLESMMGGATVLPAGESLGPTGPNAGKDRPKNNLRR